MHGFDDVSPATPSLNEPAGPWFRELNRYHWFVLIVAALGWLFDTMDQQLFVLARPSAMKELVVQIEGMSNADHAASVKEWGGVATSIFLIGWATGGLAFGVLGDKIGRAKTMLITILMYSAFTGLSALSVSVYDFIFYRFLTGLGVGGEFAVGVALVAEVMPQRARPFALGLLQALSAVGNMSAALINMGLGEMEANDMFKGIKIGGIQMNAWRIMFVIGVLPALLAIVIRRRLKEPERWQATSASTGVSEKRGSYGELFGIPLYRKRAIIGMVMASAGVIGLWGIGFFTTDLFGEVLEAKFKAEGMDPLVIKGKVTIWRGIISLLQNLGAFFGIYCFAYVSHWMGRRSAFAITYLAAFGSTLLVFLELKEFSQAFWMVPLMGFCQLALFGGFAIYFPELFPTRLRSTGASFCYNVGRYVAAIGPTMLTQLSSKVFNNTDAPFRYSGATMCGIFLVGLLVLPLAPETKGQPLPE